MTPSQNSARQRLGQWTRLVGLFALGLVVGVFFHYLLFRLGLPLKPFIYAAF
jgi:hypothetical protein